jgi:hypothetical protein
VLGTAPRGSALPAEAVSSSDTWLPKSVIENADESAGMTSSACPASARRLMTGVSSRAKV